MHVELPAEATNVGVRVDEVSLLVDQVIDRCVRVCVLVCSIVLSVRPYLVEWSKSL